MAGEKVPIGRLIDSSAGRDAIHIAICPVTAAEKLNLGERIGFVKDSTEEVWSRLGPSETLGIVDPFLSQAVLKGQRFYMFLDPNTITSLRHEWTHPAFKEEAPKEESAKKREAEAWLRAYALRQNCYDEPEEAFDRLIHGLRTREILSYGSDLHGLHELEDADNLRHYAETYLGIKINWGDYSFSCSC